jgi:hypothetical protein
MPAIERGISRGQLVPLVFGQTDLAVGQTDVQLVTAIGESGQTGTEYEAPFDGEVVAVCYTLSTVGTAGALTIGATINGTEDADTTISAGTTVAACQKVRRGAARFVAGDAIGAEITTDGSWAPITADLTVVVYVLYYLEGI